MKTNLAKILWMKEKKHWNRTMGVFKKINGWFFKLTIGFIFALLGTLCHYGFVFVSTLWQSFMFIIFRQRFKINLQRQLLRL